MSDARVIDVDVGVGTWLSSRSRIACEQHEIRAAGQHHAGDDHGRHALGMQHIARRCSVALARDREACQLSAAWSTASVL